MQVVGLEEIQDDNRKKKCMCVAQCVALTDTQIGNGCH